MQYFYCAADTAIRTVRAILWIGGNVFAVLGRFPCRRYRKSAIYAFCVDRRLAHEVFADMRNALEKAGGQPYEGEAAEGRSEDLHGSGPAPQDTLRAQAQPTAEKG